MFLSSCSSTRYVPDGEYLLRRTRVDLDHTSTALSGSERSALRNDLASLQRQEPNSRFAMMPLRSWMYSLANPEKDNLWSRFIQRAGEPPVVFDSALADQSVRQMQQYLVNKGYFNSDVHYVCHTMRRRQRMRLVFHVDPGQGYRYRNVAIDVRDDSLTHLFEDWSARTLVKSEQPYDVGVLEAERSRVVEQMRSLGYYAFSRDNIEFLIDSSLNAHLMDITMIINPPRAGGHNQQYTFGDVFIFPDQRTGRSEQQPFDTTIYRTPRSRRDTTSLNYHFIHTQPLQIKPRAIASKLAIQPGFPFNPASIDRTYENLLDLRVFRSTNITVHAQPIDTNNPQFVLNTTIEVQQAPINMWEIEFETTTTSGLQGAAINTSLQNRNLFGGAEIFSLRLRGLVEVQYLLNKAKRERFVDNYDIGISANLDIPRFIAPFRIPHTAAQRARTSINLGYSYRARPALYNRQVVGASFTYSWRQPRISHTLSPLDLNLVNVSPTDTFRKRIEEFSQTNRRLQYQYEDHFIFASRYGFSFSGQQGNRPISFNAFRFSIETSGNLLYLLSNLVGAQKNDNDQYQFLHLGYAQYIRTDADFRRYWYLSDNQVLVTRLMGGVGFAYGNSMVLPYEKGFFAGGNNNVRAWPMSQLGPGSFSPPDTLNLERIGDIVLVGNVEYRFPIAGAFKGALFVDVGNIWLRDNSELFENGKFSWRNMANDLAVGGGIGLRWDLNFFVIRLDAAVPLRNPAKPKVKNGWVTV